MTLEELLDGYLAYKEAVIESTAKLKKADKEIEELKERNDYLLKRLTEKDLETIKMARRIRELVKELAEYRGEDVK